jgi:glycosyltransferase involved in cell wall biosynthesis
VLPYGTISVVIRVRNEGAALRKVLRALEIQDIRPKEIIVVDNESSDDSRLAAQQYGAKIVEMAREDFTYGRALNIGIREAQGEFICILSAHSLPVGRDFLSKASAPFADPCIAAVRCLSVTSRIELENWTKLVVLDWPIKIETLISSAPVNSAAMIRRAVWEQIPYDETLAGVEDKFWALEVLKSGYRICNSTAMFLCLRDLGFGEQVRKLSRDRAEFFKRTGQQWKQPPVSFRRLIVNTFYTIPRRALRATVYEAALYASLKLIPYQVKHKGKIV